MTPLVSIIIPRHNAVPWLAETLESARTPTWPAKEVILVDDGSTDESPAIALRLPGAGPPDPHPAQPRHRLDAHLVAPFR